MMSKAKAAQARVFIPLRKVDEENRLVYGTITEEILDKSGEMMDYDMSKPHFEKWSGDIEAATGGLSKGNVRVMHGMVAAGKLTDITFDDDAKTIDVCAKVVDDNEWEKVLEGVYTGFSVGGSYGKKWTEDVNGTKIKKFEAKPMEVSIVDNPCVPTATFQFNKADGSVEPIMFKVAAEAAETAMVEADKDRVDASAVVTEAAGEAALPQPTNDEVVSKATDMAKAAGDGTTWMDHVTAARDELVKGTTPPKDKKDEEVEDDEADGKTDKKAADKKKPAVDAKSDDKAEKTTPAGVMQKWVTSDGEAFEKKEDAVGHENSLVVVEDDAAEKLRKALANAVETIEGAEAGEVEASVFTDLDRMHKAFVELDQPRQQDGAPALEKGMWTVRRFADLLGNAADLTRSIKAEGVLEGDDGEDANVSTAIKGTLTTLGDNFLTYAKQQVTELLAGIDTDVVSVSSCYDYYYRAAEADPENTLAKDCAALIDAVKDDIEPLAETMEKAWGTGASVVNGDESLQKNFDDLKKRYDRLEGVANTAVEQVEGLVKRVKMLEDTPLPRAPRGVAPDKEADGFFGKAASHEDKMTMLSQLIKEHGPDGVATLMIKAAHASGGQQMVLNRQ
jgi:hypothetical protein